jgi:hypothetical protein
MNASILADSVGLPSAEVCRTIAYFPCVPGRKRSKVFLSRNPAIKIQEVSCVPNTPNTLVRCVGSLVRERDSEI